MSAQIFLIRTVNENLSNVKSRHIETQSIINQNYRALFVRVVVRRRMKQRKAIRPGVGVLIIPTRDREQSPALDFVNMKKSRK